MRRTAVAHRCIIQGARLCSRRGHQFARRLIFLGRDHQQERRVDQRDDPREVAFGIVGQRAVGRREDRQRGRVREQRITVGIGLGDCGGSQRSAPAAAVVDDEGLSDLLRHLIEDRAADQVDRAPGSHRYRNADRLARPCRRLSLSQRCVRTRHQQQSCEDGAPHGKAQFGVVVTSERHHHNAFSWGVVKLGCADESVEDAKPQLDAVPEIVGSRRTRARNGGATSRPSARPWRLWPCHAASSVMVNLRVSASRCRARGGHSPLPEARHHVVTALGVAD
jgi:hypothetical protein